MRRYTGRRRAALTLIELLVVMMILVILASSVALYVVNKAEQARVARAKADIQTFQVALDTYHLGVGEYPTQEQGLEALWTPPSGVDEQKWRQGGGPFIKKQNTNDPWGNSYLYRTGGDDADYEIISYGGDGKEGGEGKNADITSADLGDAGAAND